MRVVAFFGDSGAGKTTLVERLIAWLSRQGLRVSAVKHAHHGFDIDRPGKDSWRFREAGAGQVLVASDRHWALLGREAEGYDADPDAALRRHLARLDQADFVLVEGFRNSALVPGIHVECVGRDPGGNLALRNSRQARDDVAGRPGLFAWVTDRPDAGVALAPGVPCFHRDDIDGVGMRLMHLPDWEG